MMEPCLDQKCNPGFNVLSDPAGWRFIRLDNMKPSDDDWKYVMNRIK